MTRRQWALLGMALIFAPIVAMAVLLAIDFPKLGLVFLGGGLWLGAILYCIHKSEV